MPWNGRRITGGRGRTTLTRTFRSKLGYSALIMWNRLSSNTCKRIFAPDAGSLLDIWVFDTDVQDWKLVLDHLSTKYVCVYSEDGSITSLPSVDVIARRRNEVSVSLEAMLYGFTVNCHFFETGRIEMNVLPEDVNSSEKSQAVLDLMKDIAVLLKKVVYLVPECGSASSTEFQELAVCVVDPTDHSIRSRLEVS
jgi:hypothetical protein